MFLGGSAISAFEVVDLVIYNLAVQAQTMMRRRKEQVAPTPGGAGNVKETDDKIKREEKIDDVNQHNLSSIA